MPIQKMKQNVFYYLSEDKKKWVLYNIADKNSSLIFPGSSFSVGGMFQNDKSK